MANRCCMTGNRLPIPGEFLLARLKNFIQLSNAALSFFLLRLDGIDLKLQSLLLRGDTGQFLSLLSQPGIQDPIVIGSQTCPGRSEFDGEFPVFCRFRRLRPRGIQLRLNLIHQIGQTQQVLSHPFQSTLRFDAPGLEPADSSSLFEDSPAGGWIGLQDLIDPALFNDAVGGGSRPGSHEQVADVLQPDGSTIEKILRIPALIEPASNLDLSGIDRKQALGIVKCECRLSKPAPFPSRGAVEDDVRHLLATKALGTLISKNPLDGINDVAFSASIRTDNTRNPRSELEQRSVRKALETKEFQGFQHGE
jgi:hypothetical protein